MRRGGTYFIICMFHVAILLGMLKKREEAARHYISFLKQLKAWKELHTLYA